MLHQDNGRVQKPGVACRLADRRPARPPDRAAGQRRRQPFRRAAGDTVRPLFDVSGAQIAPVDGAPDALARQRDRRTAPAASATSGTSARTARRRLALDRVERAPRRSSVDVAAPWSGAARRGARRCRAARPRSCASDADVEAGGAVDAQRDAVALHARPASMACAVTLTGSWTGAGSRARRLRVAPAERAAARASL